MIISLQPTEGAMEASGGEWAETTSPDGRKYYYNTVNGTTSWTDPRSSAAPPEYIVPEPASVPTATAQNPVDDEFADMRGMLKEGIISQEQFDQLCKDMTNEKAANQQKNNALESDLDRVMRESQQQQRARSNSTRQQAQAYEKQLMTALEQCSNAEAEAQQFKTELMQTRSLLEEARMTRRDIEDENEKLRVQNASLVKRLERVTQENVLIKHENEVANPHILLSTPHHTCHDLSSTSHTPTLTVLLTRRTP